MDTTEHYGRPSKPLKEVNDLARALGIGTGAPSAQPRFSFFLSYLRLDQHSRGSPRRGSQDFDLPCSHPAVRSSPSFSFHLLACKESEVGQVEERHVWVSTCVSAAAHKGFLQKPDRTDEKPSWALRDALVSEGVEDKRESHRPQDLCSLQQDPSVECRSTNSLATEHALS